ncbi:MAG: hypothetical protein WKF92_10100 [Pyrinomonadaceae bacterium]
MRNNIPGACLLTGNELRARRKEHLEKLAASLIDFTESGSGYIYRFPLDSSILKDLIATIDWKGNAARF